MARPENALTIVTGVGILLAWSASRGPQPPPWSFPLTLALALAGGAPIFAGAARGLLRRRSNVDVLVSIAIIAALAGGEHLAAAVVAFMMNFGTLLENVAERASGDAISMLMRLMPDTARLKTEDGYVEVQAADLRKGQVVLVREGERVPVDGTLLTGAMSVDQSSITGESIPVSKSAGDHVFAGTVNVEGVAEVGVTQTGESTTLSRIVQLVEKAKQRKAPIERLAQRYARYFTPAILAIAAAVFVLTGDWLRAITVLIVACPCSLVLATPTAMVAGIARAGLSGILVRGGDALENIGRVTTVAFDKTGTITSGRAEVFKVISLGEMGEDDAIALAASAETLSSHPLAAAIVNYARARGLQPITPSAFQALPGRGVAAMVSGRAVSVGSHYLLEDSATPAAARPLVKDLRSEGLTCLTVGVDGRPAALVAVRDEVRPGARRAIAELREAGLKRVVLLTGDNEAVARSVAAEAGIDEVHAGLLPAGKVERIEEYRAAGERVLMIGDGVNDAPALASADVGMALGMRGSDIAIESADFTLLTDDLSKAATAIRLGRRTLKVIKFNLGFSIALNVLAFIAAGLGELSPIGAAILHNVGSVIVMINAATMAVRKT